MGTKAGDTAREIEVFDRFTAQRGLRHSRPRRDILCTFLDEDRHLTAEEILRLARRRNPRVGVATVYRTMKLLTESGLCRELRIEDGAVRYEHLFGHGHHDHLICSQCGRLEEVVDPAIERLQDRLCEQKGFVADHHRLEIYGRCRTCAGFRKTPPRQRPVRRGEFR
jgi:Fur family ferric uptake transcriptional regulator